VPLGRLLPAIGWLVVAIPVLALLLRFGMRALGVRTDAPLPNFIYSATAPMVEPFYVTVPANPRFDTGVIELASLVAAGVIFAGAMMAYLFLLLVIGFFSKPAQNDERPG
jgi:uncharacterized protein YggT (Ycf19 family)